MKAGTICSTDSESYVLFIEQVNNENALCIGLRTSDQETEDSFALNSGMLESGEMKLPFFLQFSHIDNYRVNALRDTGIVIKNNELDRILRKTASFYAVLHSRIADLHKQKGNYIPVTGKVIGSGELVNMIEASLDMWLTTGRFNNDFEGRLTDFLGVRYALTVNSGSSANLLALSALTSPQLKDRALKPGDEVITVAASFPTTVTPILQNNLVPVFCDVELGTYNIAVSEIEKAITKKTRAIMLAHTLGNPFDLEPVLGLVKKYNLWLIEDNCDALGSKYLGKYTGSFGHLATLSFYPAHHITMGEGGAVLTGDKELYKILLSYRDWGRDCWCLPGHDDSCRRRFNQQHGRMPESYDHKYIYSNPGYNLKIVDWQAAIGLAQLDKLSGFIRKRRENFNVLKSNLKKLEKYLILPEENAKSEASWFGFPVTVRNGNKEKTRLVDYLEDNRIGTRHLFAGNILRQPLFVNRSFPLKIGASDILYSDKLRDSDYALLKNTETVMEATFWLGVWPGLTHENLKYITGKLTDFYSSAGGHA